MDAGFRVVRNWCHYRKPHDEQQKSTVDGRPRINFIPEKYGILAYLRLHFERPPEKDDLQSTQQRSVAFIFFDRHKCVREGVRQRSEEGISTRRRGGRPVFFQAHDRHSDVAFQRYRSSSRCKFEE